MLASKHLLKKTLLEFSQSDGVPSLEGCRSWNGPSGAVPLKTIKNSNRKVTVSWQSAFYSLRARCLSVASSSLARAPMLGGNSQRGLVTHPQKNGFCLSALLCKEPTYGREAHISQ